MRPKQWMKNLFVFAALLFVKGFTDPEKIILTGKAFLLFCLVSSAIYLVNDVVDRKDDHVHPTKHIRPIASGQVSPVLAVSVAVVCGGGALIASLYLSELFSAVLASYAVLSLLYSFWLKRLVILDVCSIALGFVLRVAGGAAVIAVPVSVWIIVCTFFLTLFLAVNKRRGELRLPPEGLRAVLRSYTPALLSELRVVSLSTVIISYTFYTFSSEHSRWLMLTVPLVLYGLFYYVYAEERGHKDGCDPTDIMLRETPLQVTVLLWVVVSGLVLFFAK